MQKVNRENSILEGAFICRTRILPSILVFFLLLIISIPKAHADDTGITSTRLIQVSDNTYVFEIDAIQSVLWAIKAPIFPDRFTVSQMEYSDNAGWIVARVTASTTGEALKHQDKILLPWARNGVSLTVQWKDGTLERGFFRRSLEGIQIPMGVLIQAEKTDLEISSESFVLGLRHIGFGFIHILLVIALFLILPGRLVFISLLWYAFGQGLSLVLIEFGVPGFDFLFTEILILLLVLMLSISASRNKKFNYVSWLILLLGLLHGLSASMELADLNLDVYQKIIAVFMFGIAVDVVQFGFALLLFPIFKTLNNRKASYKPILYTVGIISVAMAIGIFNQKVLPGDTRVVEFQTEANVVQNSLPKSQIAQSTANRPQAAIQLTTPIMSYLSVEPFEVRHEILVNVGAALELIGMEDTWMGSMPEEIQELAKEQLLDLFEKSNRTLIDSKEVKPVLTLIDFVTLGATGVFIRPEPVRESLGDGIIGITLVYETETLAKDISINWDLFTKDIEQIEATTVDPFGGATMIITPENNALEWKQSMSGYEVPKVEEIAIEKPKLPVVSFILFIIAIVLLILSGKKYRTTSIILVGIALVIYPFIRFSMNITFINQWKPSAERSTKIIDGLLTNVYRSFDYRNEEAVYDRLAISVMGDQLAQTYIEQRKGLEIENRGGASAKVNDVDVLKIHNVIAGEHSDYGIETSWTINGSVSHFGHMHYRQNRYRAIIWIAPDEGNWKIREMEIIEETRLL